MFQSALANKPHSAQQKGKRGRREAEEEQGKGKGRATTSDDERRRATTSDDKRRRATTSDDERGSLLGVARRRPASPGDAERLSASPGVARRRPVSLSVARLRGGARRCSASLGGAPRSTLLGIRRRSMLRCVARRSVSFSARRVSRRSASLDIVFNLSAIGYLGFQLQESRKPYKFSLKCALLKYQDPRAANS